MRLGAWWAESSRFKGLVVLPSIFSSQPEDLSTSLIRGTEQFTHPVHSRGYTVAVAVWQPRIVFIYWARISGHCATVWTFLIIPDIFQGKMRRLNICRLEELTPDAATVIRQRFIDCLINVIRFPFGIGFDSKILSDRRFCFLLRLKPLTLSCWPTLLLSCCWSFFFT